MDCITLVLLMILSTILLFYISSKTSKPSNLPPGPHPYPIIGKILELVGTKDPLHAFTQLSKTYGPIMTLKLGKLTSMVISSSEIAKKALQQNDVVLSSRTIPYAVCWLEEYSKNSMVWLPTNSKWRILRRACATKIFSPQQLDATQFHRKRKVQELLDYVQKCCNKGEALNIGEAIFVTVLNSLSNTILSKDVACYDGSNEKTKDFKDIIVGLTEDAGRPNVVEFFPFLQLFAPQDARVRVLSRHAKLLAFFETAAKERMHLSDSQIDSKECNDVLNFFLNHIKEEGSELCLRDVLYVFMDLFIAGIDTTSSTLEWAMAELLHNPEKMLKVKEELHQAFDKQEQQFEESQTSKLPYLNAVVKETLRLHPPAPFRVPHKSNDDVELAGFTVPKNSQILINVWSIGRDSSVWTNPNSFEPERFLESEIDFKGKNFELIPFGSGRRICPGLPLASRAMHFMLASLLHHFNWKLGDDMKPEDMDMSYSYGITLHKAQHLFVVPINKVV